MGSVEEEVDGNEAEKNILHLKLFEIKPKYVTMFT